MLGGLFGGKKKAAQQQKLSSSIAGNIFSFLGSRAIPSMPGAAQKAFQLATDPNAEARDFIEVIESDESLSARVVKIANSVYFDRGKPSRTIEESVNVIGINELRCLLNATTLGGIFPSRQPVRSQVWMNDIATAILSRSIAQKVASPKAEIAFLGGLMHDIGKLLLIQKAGDEYAKVIRLVEQRGCDFGEAEQEILGFDHTEAGQLVAESWRFSDELVHMIKNHHAPWPKERDPSDLAMIVKSADIIAHSLGLGHPTSFLRFRTAAENKLEEVWGHLGVAPASRRDELQEYRKIFEMEQDIYVDKTSR